MKTSNLTVSRDSDGPDLSPESRWAWVALDTYVYTYVRYRHELFRFTGIGYLYVEWNVPTLKLFCFAY